MTVRSLLRSKRAGQGRAAGHGGWGWSGRETAPQQRERSTTAGALHNGGSAPQQPVARNGLLAGGRRGDYAGRIRKSIENDTKSLNPTAAA